MEPITVRELMEKLAGFDPDAIICVEELKIDCSGFVEVCFGAAETVTQYENKEYQDNYGANQKGTIIAIY